jgi:hypothetical protein
MRRPSRGVKRLAKIISEEISNLDLMGRGNQQRIVLRILMMRLTSLLLVKAVLPHLLVHNQCQTP